MGCERRRPTTELFVKRFDQLTANELFHIYKLRTAVFVVEQNCPYQEVDDADRTAWHLWLWDGAEIAAYLRLMPGENAREVAIGRVVSAQRGQGLGRRILDEGIAFARKIGAMTVVLAAQTYAKGFYEKAGFRVVSGEFTEDGIPHIKMRLDLTS